ncbi:hypothetical protein NM96_01475 [Neisseria mucosa]|nr:hypothetical protein NM96_01475 [Neisseria mucosa]
MRKIDRQQSERSSENLFPVSDDLHRGACGAFDMLLAKISMKQNSSLFFCFLGREGKGDRLGIFYFTLPYYTNVRLG